MVYDWSRFVDHYRVDRQAALEAGRQYVNGDHSLIGRMEQIIDTMLTGNATLYRGLVVDEPDSVAYDIAEGAHPGYYWSLTEAGMNVAVLDMMGGRMPNVVIEGTASALAVDWAATFVKNAINPQEAEIMIADGARVRVSSVKWADRDDYGNVKWVEEVAGLRQYGRRQRQHTMEEYTEGNPVSEILEMGGAHTARDGYV